MAGPGSAGTLDICCLALFVPLFDHEKVYKDRPVPVADRLLVASLYGEVRHRVHLNPAQDSPRDEALDAIGELVGKRDDAAELLAEVAGVMLGAARFPEGQDQARRSAELLKAAGADETLIPAWIEEGRRRGAAAAKPPFSEGVPGRRPHRPR
jgi:hypothetical protein